MNLLSSTSTYFQTMYVTKDWRNVQYIDRCCQAVDQATRLYVDSVESLTETFLNLCNTKRIYEPVIRRNGLNLQFVTKENQTRDLCIQRFNIISMHDNTL